MRRAKEEAQLLKSISNLKQIGVALEAYRGDFNDHFPTNGHPPSYEGFQYGGGDPDWGVLGKTLSATNRALWPYAKLAELFHCPADQWTAPDLGLPVNITELFQLTGTSYAYNMNPWWDTPSTMLADPTNGLSGKPLSWVPNTARYILLFEPPACPVSASQTDGLPVWVIWHFRRGPAYVNSANAIRQKVISPTLFVMAMLGLMILPPRCNHLIRFKRHRHGWYKPK